MERKDDNYYVKIHPDFLFNTKFKSDITKCLYIYIKLEHNYQLQHKQSFSLDAGKMAEFFRVEETTIYRGIKELIERSFLIKDGKDKYRLKSERFVNYIKNQFIMINKNFFIDMFNGLRRLGKEASRAVQLYYYLTYKNGQYALGYGKVESNESQNKVCKALKLHNETAKRLISALEWIELVCKEDGKTYTRNKLKSNIKIEYDNPLFPKIEKVGYSDYNVAKVGQDNACDMQKTEKNEKELGWFKLDDGQFESRFVLDPEWGVVSGPLRKADGIPASTEEIEIRNYVRKYGKHPQPECK